MLTAKALERLCQPFLDTGVKTLYFARHENRVRVGAEPATAIRGAQGTPHNIEVGADELDYEALVAELNAS